MSIMTYSCSQFCEFVHLWMWIRRGWGRAEFFFFSFFKTTNLIHQDAKQISFIFLLLSSSLSSSVCGAMDRFNICIYPLHHTNRQLFVFYFFLQKKKKNPSFFAQGIMGLLSIYASVLRNMAFVIMVPITLLLSSRWCVSQSLIPNPTLLVISTANSIKCSLGGWEGRIDLHNNSNISVCMSTPLTPWLMHPSFFEYIYIYIYIYVCVCVCVWQPELLSLRLFWTTRHMKRSVWPFIGVMLQFLLILLPAKTGFDLLMLEYHLINCAKKKNKKSAGLKPYTTL